MTYHEYSTKRQNHAFTPEELNVMGFLGWECFTIIRHKNVWGITAYMAYFRRPLAEGVSRTFVALDPTGRPAGATPLD